MKHWDKEIDGLLTLVSTRQTEAGERRPVG